MTVGVVAAAAVAVDVGVVAAAAFAADVSAVAAAVAVVVAGGAADVDVVVGDDLSGRVQINLQVSWISSHS